MRIAVLALAACSSGSPTAAPPPPPPTTPNAAPAVALRGTITISGSVLDEVAHPVAGATVVVGDHTTTAAPDGTFSIAVPPGSYHVFVRDEVVMSVGAGERARLDAGPRADAARVVDEAALPTLRALADLSGVELGVIHGGTISGDVIDEHDRPVAHAVVRARGDGLRPVLGSDVDVTDDDGHFTLRVAPGGYALEASHPKLAAVRDAGVFNVNAGGTVRTELAMTPGCVVGGRVVRAGGAAVNEGAIEEQRPGGSFRASGRVEPDGTFQWSSAIPEEVSLRAWPWKSPPSEPHTFACRGGSRFDNVVLHLPDQRPDIEGVLVDATGAPVPLTYLDVRHLDPDGTDQVERTDAEGRWQVYDMPAGRYEVTATAPGRGIAIATIAAPRDDVRLQLGGTGRIAGTTTELATGSLEVVFRSCTDAFDAGGQPLGVAHEPRIVGVAGGRFFVDGVPACHLLLEVHWRGSVVPLAVAVTANQTAHVELELGPPRDKTIHGVVRDAAGHAVAHARVTAKQGDHDPSTASTDDGGRYTLHAYAGATVTASDGDRTGDATVGRSNLVDEQVDVVVGQ